MLQTNRMSFHRRGGLLKIALAMLPAVLLAGSWVVPASSQTWQKSWDFLSLSSTAPGELTISWHEPSPAPTDYRIAWALEDMDFLSWRLPNEAHRGNEYPVAGTTSITLTGLDRTADYKVKMRARYGPGGSRSGPWSDTLTARPDDSDRPARDLEQAPIDTTPVNRAQTTVGDGSVTGVAVTSDAEGVLSVSWDAASPTPTDYRVSWAPTDEDYKTWTDLTGNAFPTQTSQRITGLESDRTYKVILRSRYSDGDYADSPWSGPWTVSSFGIPDGSGSLAAEPEGTLLAGALELGAGNGGGLPIAGYSAAGTGFGSFDARYWDGSVISNHGMLFSVAQIKGTPASGAAAGLANPIVISGSLLVGNATPFILEAGGRTYSSTHAVVPEGISGGAHARVDYWIWDNPCANWESGDESYMRVVKTAPADPRLDQTDASLGSMTITGADLDSAFDSASTSHTATADANIEQVTVAVTAADDNRCSLDIVPADADPDTDGHQIDLEATGAVATITVTAADNTTVAAHTLTINPAIQRRSAPESAELDGIEFDFHPNQQRYQASPPTGVTSTSLDLVPFEDTQLDAYVFRPGGSGFARLAADDSIALSTTADTLIVVKATAPDSTEQGYYTIRLRPPPADNPPPSELSSRGSTERNAVIGWRLVSAKTTPPQLQRQSDPEPQLSALTISPGTLAPAFAAGTHQYTATVDANTEYITVTPTAAAGSTFVIASADADTETAGHQIALNPPAPRGRPSETAVLITVSAGGQVESYTLTVTREVPAAYARTAWKEIVIEPGVPLEDHEWLGTGKLSGITSDGDTVWATYSNARRLFAYSLDTGARQRSDDVDAWQTSAYLTGVTHFDGKLWAVQPWIHDRVFAFKLSNGHRLSGDDIWIRARDHSGGPGPQNNHASGLWTDGTTMWVADHADRLVYSYDLSSGERTPDKDIKRKTHHPIYQDELWDWTSRRFFEHFGLSGIWGDGVTIWLADDATSTVYAYDIATADRKDSMNFTGLGADGATNIGGMWSDGETLYVADYGLNKLFAYYMPYRAYLSSLELSGIDFDFSAATTAYSVEVDNTVTSATLSAVAPDPRATVEFSPADSSTSDDGHQVDLSNLPADITVTVTSGTTTQTYTITVTSSSS